MKDLIKQEEIIKAINIQISQYNIQQVSKIRFKVGKLTNITEKMLADFFLIAVSGKKLKSKIEIEIEWIPVTLKCNECQQVVETAYVCPKCMAEDLKIISGEEFCVEEVFY